MSKIDFSHLLRVSEDYGFPDSIVETFKVFSIDDMIRVEVKNMIEEIFELFLLKLWQEFFSTNFEFLSFSYRLSSSSVNEGTPHMLSPTWWLLKQAMSETLNPFNLNLALFFHNTAVNRKR